MPLALGCSPDCVDTEQGLTAGDRRQPLLRLLGRFADSCAAAAPDAASFRAFAHEHPDCFERSCIPGHFTGSAWLVDGAGRRILLTQHRKLNRWLQLGGHADGNPDPAQVALREAQEESGMETFELAVIGPERTFFDIDIHVIPALGGEPAHLHHDLRYLLVAGPGQELRVSSESNDLRWFPVARALEVLDDPSLLRMARKTGEWLRGSAS